MSAPARAEAATAPGASRRLVGVDVARGIALLAMMATHALPGTDPDGSVSTAFAIASGRASALFAVLAGVGLALLTGGAAPLRGPALAAARRGVLGRAVVLAVIGLVLGLWPSGVAVILVNYGLLFAVAALFLGLRARWLVPLALAWVLLAPVLAHVLRPLAPPTTYDVPDVLSLLHPVRAVSELLLTGYYPVLVWTGYLLVGLAAGRLALGRARVATALVVVGALAAVAAELASRALVRAAGGLEAIAGGATAGGRALLEADGAGGVRLGDLYGTTPTTSWWWLAVRAPHAGTPPDLVHTAGCALAVLGACLLLTRWRPAAVVLAPLAAAGSLTLTLYTLHVLALPVMALLLPGGVVYATQVVGLLALATAWRFGADRGALPRRGPLEQLAATGASAARGRSLPR